MTRIAPVFPADMTESDRVRYTDRFWLKVDRSAGPEGCWPFTDATLHGYGVFRAGKRKVKAHRFAWVAEFGTEPGETLDHLCHRPIECQVPSADCLHRRCCNPRHLFDSPLGVNLARGNPAYRQYASRDACSAGHTYTPESTYVTAQGNRQCRVCSAERARARRAEWTPPGRTGEYRPRSMSLGQLVDWALAHNRGDGCWSWGDAQPGVAGYVYVKHAGKDTATHRLVYEARVGPIPSGLQIDHLCHDPRSCPGGRDCPHRACVNPAHLGAVTGAENSSASRSAQGGQVECLRGHAFTEANTYVGSTGKRHCRACASLSMQASAHPTGWVPEPTGDDRVTCRSGRHEWSEAGTYEDRGVRKCRECDRARKARYRARRKESPGAGSVPGATITKEHDEH